MPTTKFRASGEDDSGTSRKKETCTSRGRLVDQGKRVSRTKFLCVRAQETDERGSGDVVAGTDAMRRHFSTGNQAIQKSDEHEHALEFIRRTHWENSKMILKYRRQPNALITVALSKLL
ncbi:uncharacterized protein PITG_11243 [Phytophthora infestans T30-4]|uniref:Uncharacterized protein n=1 Tax=Phytophthora infestans (strain T30-4) TaxID=403677 RepID=D0NGJ1_PHYIT|nr:uncharacterized protein PITG_11243 [Phytophthora infestans T30-4]EEY57392.1 hypothetical protein PITG_11243 [Phytophthora infestans T30-4]|eukprot:XP_002902002.1 hypothetical protein PITG_11243 [Phytophthora infestans T30-4]